MKKKENHTFYHILTFIAVLAIGISLRIVMIIRPSPEIRPIPQIQALESNSITPNIIGPNEKKFFDHIEKDEWEMAMKMVENNKVNPNAKNPKQCYWTAAHYAADNITRLEQLKLLGSDLSIRDEVGRTILHIQSYRGRTRCVVWSLDNGISPNSKDSIGQTPLHYAAKMDANTKKNNYPVVEADHELVINILLNKGAHLYAEDANGDTPLDLAVKTNRQDVLPILQSKSLKN